MTDNKWPCLKPIRKPCSCGCGKFVFRNKYVIKKYPKSFVKGHHWRGEFNVNWNNGRMRKDGYILIRKDHPNSGKNGYVREHVFVMSKKINRPIGKDEVIHHINGIRNDNRIENLILMKRSHHTSHHHKGIKNPKKSHWGNTYKRDYARNHEKLSFV